MARTIRAVKAPRYRDFSKLTDAEIRRAAKRLAMRVPKTPTQFEEWAERARNNAAIARIMRMTITV